MKYSAFSLALRHFLITALLFTVGLLVPMSYDEYAFMDMIGTFVFVAAFASPGLLISWLVLYRLERAGAHPGVAWVCLLLSNIAAVAACFAVFYFTTSISIHYVMPLPLYAVGAVWLATLFCLIPFNKFFHFSYESKNNTEDYQDYADLLHD